MGAVHGRIAVAVFASLMVAGCVSDLRTRRIPNVLVACIAVGGVVYSLVEAPSRVGLIRAASGLGIGLLVWLPFYLVRAIGAGDVKFFAAASAWLGVRSTLQAAAVTALVGAVLALVWMVRTDGWRHVITRAALSLHQTLSPAADRGLTAPPRPLPYGVAMAVGLAIAAWLPLSSG